MTAPSDPPDSLVFECDFEEPPEKVWRALTEPRLLEAWLTPQDSAPTDGRDGNEPNVRPVDASDYKIVAAEPHRLLRYRCRDRERAAGGGGGDEVHSVVTIELAPRPTGGTHLRLTHGEFRIVSAAPTLMAARIGTVTSARGRTPMLALPARCGLRRAA